MNIVRRLAVAVVISAVVTGAVIQSNNRVQVIAHRGASGYAPEHTFAAWDLALEQGADYIEQDLQLTRDGVLIVMHDDSLQRTARGSASCAGAVRDRTAAELADCEVGRWFNAARPEVASSAFEGLRIPTLREVLARYAGRTRFYIETKSPESAPGMEAALVAELERADLLPKSISDRTVLVQSFSAASLRRLHALRPTIPLVLLLSSVRGDLDSLLADAARYAIGVGPTARLVDSAFVASANRHGLVVHPWTVNDSVAMQRLVALGVAGMFTDYPDRLARVLGRR